MWIHEINLRQAMCPSIPPCYEGKYFAEKMFANVAKHLLLLCHVAVCVKYTLKQLNGLKCCFYKNITFSFVSNVLISGGVYFRVLTVHGSMDKIVPVEDAMEFAKFIPNHKLHIIEGANHEYTSHQDELASVVLHFIRAHFHPDKDIHGRLPLCTRVDQSAQSRL